MKLELNYHLPPQICCRTTFSQETQLLLTIRATRLEASQDHTKHGIIRC